MEQWFDDIQISDKGMIKLIRNEGKNYIFPASNIIRVYGVKPYTISFWDTWKKDRMVGLETNDGDLIVRVTLTDDLKKRIDLARSYSNERAREKYGVFK